MDLELGLDMAVAQTKIAEGSVALGKAIPFAHYVGTTRKLVPTAPISHSAFWRALSKAMPAFSLVAFAPVSNFAVRLRLRSATRFLSTVASRCFNNLQHRIQHCVLLQCARR